MQCIMEALQEVIAAGEVPGEPSNGYGTLVKGTVYSAPPPFTNLIGQRNVQLDPSKLSGHPGIQVQWNPAYKTSSAFGRYQITVGTAAAYGITDFSPRGQDAGAETIMKALGMVVPAMQGNLAQAMALGSSTWASLPGANAPGQNSMSLAKARSVFNNALDTLPDCQ
jgi:muramidase (phage lysozyme)